MNGLILALDGVNQYFLSIAAALLVLVAGAAFTARFRAFYLLHPRRTLRAMPRGGAKQMLLSLGGTVGVGNISGVAVALTLGGAGAVFWMWVGAFVTMALKYAEIILGMLHRETLGGKTVGGAPYYIRAALGKGAAALFAGLLVFDSVAVGGVIQSSAIAEAAAGLGVAPFATGIAISLAAAAVFFFGIDLFSLSAVLVPVMAVGYIAASAAVIAANAENLPAAFGAVFAGAFRPAAASGGLVGFLLSPALRQGIVKGLFSNEAGCGTAAAAHAASKETVPARQGLFGIFEVFCDTVLLCTITALAILTALGDDLAAYGAAGVRLCTAAFATVFGHGAAPLLFAFVLLFAFATIVAYGYYGMESLRYFAHGARYQGAFLVAYCLSQLCGAVAAPAAVWTLSDTVICLLLFVNMAAVTARAGEICAAHDAFYVQMGKYAQSASKMKSRRAASAKKESAISDRVTNSGEMPYFAQNRAK